MQLIVLTDFSMPVVQCVTAVIASAAAAVLTTLLFLQRAAMLAFQALY